jgi:dipeptidyl aminopeptidase/acylaminoacyl peptidase
MRMLVVVVLIVTLTVTAIAQGKGPSDYSALPNAPFTAEEITLQVKTYTLAGTLLLPKSRTRPLPAVITITGSGQQTRDEPLPLPGLEKYKPMRQIAELLAGRGIAVLRVDDRGIGSSTGRETLMAATTSDFADDVRAQVAYLRSRSEINGNRIALVGHSEGGTIASMLAASDPRIAAIVLMAGAGKSGALISMEQLSAVLDQDTSVTDEQKMQKLAEEQEVIHAVQTGADLSKYPAQVRLPWVREFWTYDPLPTIRKVRQPILILQGALDRQVSAEQATMLEEAARSTGNKDVTKRMFPNLNHLFLPARTGAFSEYTKLEITAIPDEVITVLGNWLQTRLNAKENTNAR